MRAHLLPLLAFGGLITSAAVVYPGGNFQDRRDLGFSFWRNFWCDLLGAVAINGEPNLRASLLARLAFACFALALYRFWPGAALRAGGGPAAESGVRIGRIGAVALLAVALVPSSTSELFHGIAVLASAGASAIATVRMVGGLARKGELWGAILGAAVAATALVCLGQYVYQGLISHEPATWLAGMQKITTVFLLAFMLRLVAKPSVVAASPSRALLPEAPRS